MPQDPLDELIAGAPMAGAKLQVAQRLHGTVSKKKAALRSASPSCSWPTLNFTECMRWSASSKIHNCQWGAGTSITAISDYPVSPCSAPQRVNTKMFAGLQSTVYCWLGKAAVDRINGAAIDFTSVVGPAKRPVHDGERRGAYDTSEWRALTATEHDTETWQGLQALSDNHGGNGRAFTATGHTLRRGLLATKRNPETRHGLQTLSNNSAAMLSFRLQRARTETPRALRQSDGKFELSPL